MQELLLRKDIFGLVKSGIKHSTSRKGKRDIQCGLLLFKMTEDESIQEIVDVTNVRYTPYCEISNEEAIKEGYKSIEELRSVLTNIYGNISDDELFTFIEFKLHKPNFENHTGDNYG